MKTRTKIKTNTLQKIIFDMITAAKIAPGVNIRPDPLGRGLRLAARYNPKDQTFQIAAWVPNDPKRPGMNELLVIAAESPGWLTFGQWMETKDANGQVYQIVICKERQPKSETGAKTPELQKDIA